MSGARSFWYKGESFKEGKMIAVNFALASSILLVALAMPASAESVFHVAPGGKDSAPGTAEKPFATLERARRAVREAGAQGRRSVIVHGGSYEIERTLELGPEDSGSEAAPVTWGPAPGEAARLVGGKAIPAEAFRPVGDPAITARLDPAALGWFGRSGHPLHAGDPPAALRGASHITLRGFVVECGLGDGITVAGGTGCRIEACEFRNLRSMGIRITGGTKHRVEACQVHETGTGGMLLEGGDRKTLSPAGHEAVNNHIWRFSTLQLTYAYGLVLAGVGNRAAHNLIHDAPHEAATLSGNDHIFEYNEVHHVCTETDDSGALHKGRNPSCRGNQIRFNYWHDMGSGMGHGSAAVYFDDGDGGDRVYGNVFYRCGDPGLGAFGTVFSHGGHDTWAENNIFIDCRRALGSAPWDDARWRDALRGGQDCQFPDKLLREVDISKPPYTTRYPELVGFMDPPPGAKRVNHARRNVMVRCAEASGGNWELEAAENFISDRDPGFVDAGGQ